MEPWAMDFRWNEWNLEHVEKHGVSPAEAEFVVVNATRPYPMSAREGTLLVRGPGWGGRLLQVVYVVDPEDTIYVIHARPLDEGEKRHFRRRCR
jgi:uncharacterized DUF497 family protein